MSNPAPTALVPGAGRPVWLRVGRAFDGFAVAPGPVHLVYDDARVRHCGAGAPPADAVRPGQTAPDLDLPSHTALPGLIEAHAHLFLEGGEEDPAKRAAALELSPEELLARALPRLPRLRRLGIAAVRDAGDKDGVGLALQARWRSPARGAMPWLDSPGAAIHRKGRYGKFMGRPLEEQGSLEGAVLDRVAAGAHRIKLLATGIINFERGAVTVPPQFSGEELAVAVEVAHRHGRQAFAHCSGADGADVCLAAGVDTLEHGFFLRQDQLPRLRDRDIGWVPTFAPVRYQLDAADRLGWSDTVRDHLRRILDQHAVSLVRAAALGVKLIAGSDAGSHGVPHGHGFFRELELMEEAGLGAVTVLAAATGVAAHRLGLAAEAGVLRAGGPARFLLTDAPVLESVRHLRTPGWVVFDGAVEAGGDDPAQPGL